MSSREQLQQFKRELWKDQRLLETRDSEGGVVLVKHFGRRQERDTELHVIDYLRSVVGIKHVPAIRGTTDDSITLTYIRGIRLFNLLVELDRLPSHLRRRGEEAKINLLARADANQAHIQAALATIPRLADWRPYPAGQKILRIIQILAPSLDFVFERRGLERELEDLDARWFPMTVVPFRDATTKNMVLAAPDLWIGAYDGEDARYDTMVRSFETDDAPAWLAADLVDFDFASCGEISTLEDDYVSLHFHERTWIHPPTTAQDLLWGAHDASGERAALTFLTRYYRFGGRKAAYRLLHPWGHRVRFRHDGDAFYFERLPVIVQRLSPEVAEQFPLLIGVTKAIARTLEAGRPGVDQFIAAGLAEKRNYFVDMYWDRPPDHE
jgi:hypothetical protein